jgi:hypothetical protein
VLRASPAAVVGAGEAGVAHARVAKFQLALELGGGAAV